MNLSDEKAADAAVRDALRPLVPAFDTDQAWAELSATLRSTNEDGAVVGLAPPGRGARRAGSEGRRRKVWLAAAAVLVAATVGGIAKLGPPTEYVQSGGPVPIGSVPEASVPSTELSGPANADLPAAPAAIPNWVPAGYSLWDTRTYPPGVDIANRWSVTQLLRHPVTRAVVLVGMRPTDSMPESDPTAQVLDLRGTKATERTSTDGAREIAWYEHGTEVSAWIPGLDRAASVALLQTLIAPPRGLDEGFTLPADSPYSLATDHLSQKQTTRLTYGSADGAAPRLEVEVSDGWLGIEPAIRTRIAQGEMPADGIYRVPSAQSGSNTFLAVWSDGLSVKVQGGPGDLASLERIAISAARVDDGRRQSLASDIVKNFTALPSLGSSTTSAGVKLTLRGATAPVVACIDLPGKATACRPTDAVNRPDALPQDAEAWMTTLMVGDRWFFPLITDNGRPGHFTVGDTPAKPSPTGAVPFEHLAFDRWQIDLGDFGPEVRQLSLGWQGPTTIPGMSFHR